MSSDKQTSTFNAVKNFLVSFTFFKNSVMKKIVLLLGLLTTFSIVQAQLLKKIKDKVDKTVDDATKEKKDEKGSGETNENTGTGNKAEPATMKTYSKYDFVPGERIIVFEDFSQDAVGDLPAKWNTNSSAETVTIDGKPGHWMKMTKGAYMPDFIDSLGDDFTLEYDLVVDKPDAGSWGISPVLGEIKDRDKLENWRDANNFLLLNLIPGRAVMGVVTMRGRKWEASTNHPL